MSDIASLLNMGAGAAGMTAGPGVAGKGVSSGGEFSGFLSLGLNGHDETDISDGLTDSQDEAPFGDLSETDLSSPGFELVMISRKAGTTADGTVGELRKEPEEAENQIAGIVSMSVPADLGLISRLNLSGAEPAPVADPTISGSDLIDTDMPTPEDAVEMTVLPAGQGPVMTPDAPLPERSDAGLTDFTDENGRFRLPVDMASGPDRARYFSDAPVIAGSGSENVRMADDGAPRSDVSFANEAEFMMRAEAGVVPPVPRIVTGTSDTSVLPDPVPAGPGSDGPPKAVPDLPGEIPYGAEELLAPLPVDREVDDMPSTESMPSRPADRTAEVTSATPIRTRTSVIRPETPSTTVDAGDAVQAEPESSPSPSISTAPRAVVAPPEGVLPTAPPPTAIPVAPPADRIDPRTPAEAAGRPSQARSGVSAIMDTVAAGLRSVRIAEEGVTTIRLRPAGLGLIEIEISRHLSDGAQLSLRVQNPMVLDALRLDRGGLGDLLTRNGLDGAAMDLSGFGSGEQGRGGEGREARGPTHASDPRAIAAESQTDQEAPDGDPASGVNILI